MNRLIAMIDRHDPTYRMCRHRIEAFVDGVRVRLDITESGATGTFPGDARSAPHSEWRAPYGPLIVVVARSADGAVAGALATTVGSPL